MAFAPILATITLPLDIRVITTYQVAANIFRCFNAVLDFTGLNSLIEILHPVQPELSVLSTPILARSRHWSRMARVRSCFASFPDTAEGLLQGCAHGWGGADPLPHRYPPAACPHQLRLAVRAHLPQRLDGNICGLLVGASTPDMQTAVVGLARLVPDADGQVPDFPMIMAGAVFVPTLFPPR